MSKQAKFVGYLSAEYLLGPHLVNNLITPWFVVNAFAPRKLVYAHEFWYEGEEGPGYPEVWVPAWPRYEKV